MRGICGRRRDQFDRHRGRQSTTVVQFAIGTPIDRAVNDVRERGRADPRQPARRHPRAADQPRRHRPAIRSPIMSRSSDRHDARAAELVHRQHRRARRLLSVPGMADGRAQRRRRPRNPRRSSIRRKLQAQGLTASQVNAPAARRSTSTPPAAAPRSPAPNSRCACSATPRTPTRSARRRSAVGNGRTIKLADIADVRDLYAEQRSLAKLERPPGAQLRLPARQGRVGRHRLRRGDEGAAAAREGQSQGPFHAALHLGQIYQDAV